MHPSRSIRRSQLQHHQPPKYRHSPRTPVDPPYRRSQLQRHSRPHRQALHPQLRLPQHSRPHGQRVPMRRSHSTRQPRIQRVRCSHHFDPRPPTRRYPLKSQLGKLVRIPSLICRYRRTARSPGRPVIRTRIRYGCGGSRGRCGFGRQPRVNWRPSKSKLLSIQQTRQLLASPREPPPIATIRSVGG